MALSVVSVGAHQDDELSCLGTLIRCAQRGDRVTTVAVSNGDKGGSHDPTIPHEEIARIRIAEATAVIGSLGGEFYCVGQEDEYIMDTKEARQDVARILREVKADVVLTCPPTDYNIDHIRAGEIAAHAAFLASISTIDLGVAPLAQAPQVFYFDSIGSVDFQPVLYVDVSDVFDRKCELLRLHATQMASQPHATGWDLVTHVEAVNRLRGLQSNVRYAEGFAPVLRVPLIRTGWPLP